MKGVKNRIEKRLQKKKEKIEKKKLQLEKKVTAEDGTRLTWAGIIVKGSRYITKLFVALVIFCAIMNAFVKVNYDLTEYLPETVPSKKAIDVMEKEFGYPGTARIMIEDVTIYEARLYKQLIENVDGVDRVSWMSEDIYMSKEFTEAEDETDYYKDNCAVMDIAFVYGDTDDRTKQAINDIKDILGDKGRYSGPAIENASLETTLDKQIQIIMVVAVVMIALILCLTTNSWAEPILFLIVMGVAIILNQGSNIIMGTISFLSSSVASVLQLAISIDYSVFLLHTFVHEKSKGYENEIAMEKALQSSALSIMSSAMTTFVGFMALLTMTFKIGQDVGLVLAKSIICSVITVMFLMPALILKFDGWIQKTQHRTILPKFDLLSRAAFKLRYVIIVIFIIVAVPSYIMQNSNSNTYGNSSLGSSEGTQVYEDTQLIEAKFGRSNLYLIMVPNGSPIMERELSEELEDLYYVKSVTSLSKELPVGVPEDFVPESITGLLRSDNYTRILLYTKTKSESDFAFQTCDEIQKIVEKYYPENAYVAGNTPSTEDLKVICQSDYAIVNALTIAGVGLVVAIAFKSILLPIIVLIPINIATFVNMAVPYLQGITFMFFALVIVGCIQLGATVDYSILLTNNYLNFREGKKQGRKEAALNAFKASILSILTSGSILTVAGYAIYFISTVAAIQNIGEMVGRGALISMFMVLLGIPSLLYFLDPWVYRERILFATIKEKITGKKTELDLPDDIKEMFEKKKTKKDLKKKSKNKSAERRDVDNEK